MAKKHSVSAAQKKKILLAARAARKNAYCPHSGFAVGAALLTASGKIYRGANVENASFGATICAERSAAVAAVSAGEKEFLAIAVVADGDAPPVPCGQCLQVLAEFVSPDFPLFLAALDLKPVRSLRLRNLLPETFIFSK